MANSDYRNLNYVDTPTAYGNNNGLQSVLATSSILLSKKLIECIQWEKIIFSKLVNLEISL